MTTTTIAAEKKGSHAGEQVTKNKKWDDAPDRVPIPIERRSRAGTFLRPDGAFVDDDARFVDAPGDDAARDVLPLAAFLASTARTGVILLPTDDARLLQPHLARATRIVLQTAPGKFRDGRLYSQAGILRELGYEGPLRAKGDVIADQVFFLARVGFDEIELREGEDVDVARRALKTFSHAYQPSHGDRRPVGRRHRGPGA